MRENFTYGSVRGAAGDGSPYRDSTTPTSNVDGALASNCIWATDDHATASRHLDV